MGGGQDPCVSPRAILNISSCIAIYIGQQHPADNVSLQMCNSHISTSESEAQKRNTYVSI